MAAPSDSDSANGGAVRQVPRFIQFSPEALQRCARLTRRERDVLGAFATAAVTHEVARHLGIAVDDVRAHLDSAVRTLHARSKLEAVLLALAAGVIDEPPA